MSIKAYKSQLNAPLYILYVAASYYSAEGHDIPTVGIYFPD